MDEKNSLREQIEAVQEERLEKSELVKAIYSKAKKTGGHFKESKELIDFIALTKILGLTRDETILSELKQAYISGAIMPPHWGGNVDIGLLEFVDGMKELGTTDEEISGYINQTLEYRVVEGMAIGGILECVGIPFVKEEPAKTKTKVKLKKLQKESTSFKSNQNATYKSSWEKGRARRIERLFREHEESLYELARINDEINNHFDYFKEVRDWREKATVKDNKYRWKEEIKPELLSDEGREGRYKKLLTKEIQLQNDMEFIEGEDDRAVELASLDIILDSNYVAGPSGKGASYASALYHRMFDISKAIKSPEHLIMQIRTTAKERYNLDL